MLEIPEEVEVSYDIIIACIQGSDNLETTTQH